MGAALRLTAAWIVVGLLLATSALRLLNLPEEIRMERSLSAICGRLAQR